MTKNEEKIKAKKKFEKLENFLRGNLGNKNKKIEIIKKIRRKILKNKKKESEFVKEFLEPILSRYFQKHSIDVIVEGKNSIGRTQFKNEFFGVKPAIDFLFKHENPSIFPSQYNVPFPLDTVGEVKYEKLTFRNFAIGLGQIIGYLAASKFEQNPKIYGYYIFFNTDVDKSITDKDREFLDEIWEKENVFIVIL